MQSRAKDSARIALVTGGARRLGREAVLALGRAGWGVAVHHGSSPDEAGSTVRELEALGVPAVPFAADLTRDGAAARLVEAVVSRFGRLDLLVHAASPFVPSGFEAVTEKAWDETFAVVPRAAFFLAQAAAPSLREASGSIVLFSDVAARQAWPRFIPHAAAKAAVEALVRNLAVALAPEVRVNGIAPGVVLPPVSMGAAEIERLVKRTPLRRRVAVEDVSSALLFLADNGSVTGQILDVDAGRSIHWPAGS